MNLHIDSTHSGCGTVQGAAESQIFTSEGLWCFSQSLSAASILASHPSPVAMKASSTAADSSIVMAIFPSSVLAVVGIIIQAALPMVKSKCIASYGNTVPRSPRSSISLARRAVTSVCTPLTSRPTRAAISRIVISPEPVIAISMAMRFGDSVLCSSCQSGKEITSSPVPFAPSAAARKADMTSVLKLFIVSTRMVTVFMSFSFSQGHDFIDEILQQLLYRDKVSADFPIADVFMVAFTPFIIVAHHTDATGDIGKAVLEIMLATRNGGVNLPYNDSDVVCAIQLAFKLSIKPGWHCFVPLRYVVNNNNTTTCCQIGQQNTVDHLSSGRYSSRAAAKSAAGIGVPVSNVAHNRAQAVFLCAAQLHLSMVGRAGAPKGAPGSTLTGYANPVRLTTSVIGVSGGEFKKLNVEAAIMATIPTRTQPEVLLVEGRAVTTSLAVAAYFSKDHKNVIQKIQSLECSPEFTELNFQLSEYSDPTGRTLPCYEITRDGFAFLAMGFTGKKAATFKESYINAFNRMETMLSGGSSPASALPGQIELLITLENGAVVDSRPVRKGELVACFETFIELAERRGFLVIHRDDLASLSFGVRRRGDS